MKEKRDVLFLCQYFYPEYVSSAVLPYETAYDMSNDNLKVDVLCGYPQEYLKGETVMKEEEHSGIRIKRINYLSLNKNNIVGRLVSHFSFTISSALKINQFKNYKAVVVYSNPPVLPIISVIAKKLFGTKFVFVSYDVYPEIAYNSNMIKKRSLMGYMMKVINKMVFNNASKIIALSNDMKKFLLSNREGISEKDIEVIPNWYEDKIKEIPQDYEIDYGPFQHSNRRPLIISYLGNLGTAQDLETLLTAIRHFKNSKKVHFIFAGHGNKMNYLKKYIEEEDILNVTVYGYLHGNDFLKILGVSDMFVVSLIKNITGLAVPSKVYTYMMAGKPILSIMDKHTDIAKNLESYKAGYAIGVGDSKKLIDIIENVDSNELEIKGNNSRKLFLEKYTRKSSTNRYINLVKGLIRG